MDSTARIERVDYRWDSDSTLEITWRTEPAGTMDTLGLYGWKNANGMNYKD